MISKPKEYRITKARVSKSKYSQVTKLKARLWFMTEKWKFLPHWIFQYWANQKMMMASFIPSEYTNTIPSVTWVVERKCAKCLNSGGERGIWTPGRVTPTPVFETGPFSRSGISPFWWLPSCQVIWHFNRPSLFNCVQVTSLRAKRWLNGPGKQVTLPR